MSKVAALFAVIALAGCGGTTHRDTAKQGADYIMLQRPSTLPALCAAIHAVGVRLANATFDGTYNETPYGKSRIAAPADQVFIELFARCPRR